MFRSNPIDGTRCIRRRWRDRWSRRRRAIVLLLVLVAIVVLSLSAYTACDVMHLHRRATRAAGRQIQARYLADSGVAALMAYLATGGGKQPLTVNDDVDRFRGVLVVAGRDPTDNGGFSIVAPEHVPGEHGRSVRFGVENESGRLNLNAILRAEQNRAGAGKEILLGLPGMSEDIAAAILDWMDEDDEPRPLGAENAHYRQLDPPYSARNGPLHSVEDLLLVRGVTPELLFGRDRNRNYRVDPHEQRSHAPSATRFAADLAPLGWATYLTVYTKVAEDQAESDAELPRVWVNQPDMRQLYDELLEVFGNNKQWAMFVVAYRQHGPSTSDPTLNSATDRDLDLSLPGNFSIAHPLDLMGVNVEVVLAGDTEPVVLSSPFLTDDSLDFYFGELESKLAIDETPPVFGGVDVMHASPEVMSSLPGMSPAAIDEILARRETATDADAAEKPDALWLFREGIVSLDEMRILAPHVQSGGEIYRAQVVGYTHDGKAARRLEVVLDAGRQPPRLLLRRDLSHLGRGYSLRELGVDQPFVETWSAGESAGH